MFLNLSKGIPAKSSVPVYMNFMTYNIMTSNNSYTGEAPQLSSIYGQYDNGNKVFNYYNNFKNSSSLTGIAYIQNASANDGLMLNYRGLISGNIGGSGASFNPTSNISVDMYANMPISKTNTFDAIGLVFPYQTTSSGMQTSIYDQAASDPIAVWVQSNILGANMYALTSNSPTAYAANNILSPIGAHVYSVGLSNVDVKNGTMYFSYDYGKPLQISTYNSSSNYRIGAFDNQTGQSFKITWIALRKYYGLHNPTGTIGALNS